jgi:hypothetical protein
LLRTSGSWPSTSFGQHLDVLAAAFLVTAAEMPGRYRFVHSLIREGAPLARDAAYSYPPIGDAAGGAIVPAADLVTFLPAPRC